MTPQQALEVVRWSRERAEEYGGLTGSHINAPAGATLGEAFSMLYALAAEGLAARGLMQSPSASPQNTPGF